MSNEFLAEPPPQPHLFSIRAISVGTFIGGPLAAGIFIGLNFRRLGNRSTANIAFVLGAVSAALLFVGIFLLPSEIGDNIPQHLLPAIYTPLAAFIAKWLQGNAIERAIENGACKASGWVITGWSIASLIVTLGAVVPFVLSMPPFGFHGDKETFGPKGAYEVYAAGDISPAEIKALADYLVRCEYFAGEDLHLAQVVKNKDGYILSLPVDRQLWEKPEFLANLRNIKIEIGQSVLKGKLTLILIDEDLRKTYKKEL